jgi:hypothetical protein
MDHLVVWGGRSILYLRDQLTDDTVSAKVRGVQQKNDYDCKLSDCSCVGERPRRALDANSVTQVVQINGDALKQK